MQQLAWVVLSFFLGSIPFAVWLGRWKNIAVQAVGDGNPGAFNAWKAGGWRLGLPVLVLDFFKAALPVGIACQIWAWEDGWLVAAAIAPILGHAFSPFMHGRGGKALAATFGVWTALTQAEGALILGLALTTAVVGLRLRHGWSILLGMGLLIFYLTLRKQPAIYLLIWCLTAAWLTWAYRADLRFPMRKAKP